MTNHRILKHILLMNKEELTIQKTSLITTFNINYICRNCQISVSFKSHLNQCDYILYNMKIQILYSIVYKT